MEPAEIANIDTPLALDVLVPEHCGLLPTSFILLALKAWAFAKNQMGTDSVMRRLLLDVASLLVGLSIARFRAAPNSSPSELSAGRF